MPLPRTFLIFDSSGMKSLWFNFGHDIFIGFKMVFLKVGRPIFQPFQEMKLKLLSLKSWHFEASEDILTKF